MSTTVQEDSPRNTTSPRKQRVGIIGDGKVGSAIKRGLQRLGYDVIAVGKDPKQVAETSRWAELLVLAVPYSAVNDSLAEMGEGVNGKVLIDATNPLNAGGLAIGFTTSGAEEIQKRVPKAHVVKAFNTVFASHMDTGRAKGRQLVFFVAGDDKEAKARVLRLGEEIGFDPVDAGPLSSARLLESTAYLLIFMGFSLGMSTDIGFSLVH